MKHIPALSSAFCTQARRRCMRDMWLQALYSCFSIMLCVHTPYHSSLLHCRAVEIMSTGIPIGCVHLLSIGWNKMHLVLAEHTNTVLYTV